MNIQMHLQNSDDGTTYDISSLVTGLQISSSLALGQPGKMVFTVERDPNEVLSISPGSRVHLTVDGKGVFFGYCFTMGRDKDGIHRITAYDQTRYLKNEEMTVTEGETASQVFERLCVAHGLKYDIVTPTTFIPETIVHAGRSLFAIMERLIMLTNISEKRHYFIRDNFGVLEFTAVDRLKSNLVIGDGSLLTSYQYEISIDNDTYNTVKIVQEDEETGRLGVWIEFDSDNQKRWGKLQRLNVAAQGMNDAEIRSRASMLMEYHNRPTKTMRLTGIGSTDVDALSLRAGSGFTLALNDLGINESMWITNATHSINDDYHTFAWDVFI